MFPHRFVRAEARIYTDRVGRISASRSPPNSFWLLYERCVEKKQGLGAKWALAWKGFT